MPAFTPLTASSQHRAQPPLGQRLSNALDALLVDGDVLVVRRGLFVGVGRRIAQAIEVCRDAVGGLPALANQVCGVGESVVVHGAKSSAANSPTND